MAYKVKKKKIRKIYGDKYYVVKGKPIVRVDYAINFTDWEMKGKKFKTPKKWVIKESGEVGKIYKGRSGKEALAKYRRKWGITSRVVNISLYKK
jgi:hypothetical protein